MGVGLCGCSSLQGLDSFVSSWSGSGGPEDNSSEEQKVAPTKFFVAVPDTWKEYCLLGNTCFLCLFNLNLKSSSCGVCAGSATLLSL